MAITLTTTGTGIWARFGKLFGILDRTTDFVVGSSSIVDAGTKSFQEAINEYIPLVGSAGGSTVNTDLEFATSLTIGLDGLRNQILNTVYSRLKVVADRTLIEMVNDDASISVKGVHVALKELRDQMGSSNDINASAITTTAQASIAKTTANTGTVIIGLLPDTINNGNSVAIPTIRTESLTFRCVKDATNNSIAKGAELFQIEGEQAFPPNDHRWPGGSGMHGPIACTSDNTGDGRVQTRNTLRNSSFNTFASNVPTAWEIAVGSAGATVLEETSTVARGSSCLKMASDGSTVIHVRQKMNSRVVGSGNSGQMQGDDYFAISFLARKSAAASAGVLKVGLTNADGFSYSNFVEVAHGDISHTGWTQVTASFRLSQSFDYENVYFSLQQTTAFTNTKSLFIDGLVFTKMYQTAPGGFHCAIVPGLIDFKKGDTVTTANANDGAGTIGHMMDRFFDLYNRGIFIPDQTDTSETIADSLIA